MKIGIEQLADKIGKENFEIIFHNSWYTKQDMADYFGISIGNINKLQAYWNLNWSNDEISERKRINAKKYDCSRAIEKRHKTNINLYGTKNPRALLYPESYIYSEEKNKLVNKKRIETNLDRFGVSYYSQTKEFKELMPQTMQVTNLNKYGETSYAKTLDFHRKAKKKYYYDNNYFDSSWELYYYIYMKEHKNTIERNTTIKYTYLCNNKEHVYVPDFIVNNNIVIEIKGSQYLDTNGVLINPYVNRNQDLAIAKYNCMLNNNVKILTKKDLQPLFYEIEIKYGKNYYKNFIIR